MTVTIGRRELLVALGGSATIGLPLAARAQQTKMPVLGFLGSASEERYEAIRRAIRSGLNEAGFVEQRNLLMEYRWADFRYERLPALAAELVARPVDVIFTTGSVVSALAAKASTGTIPIVFANGSDPVQHGLVASLNRPGGNITGISFINAQLVPKRLQLLKLLNPTTAAILLAATLGVADIGVSSCWSMCHDIGGSSAGMVSGCMNTFANIGGAISPLVVGYAVDLWGSWTVPFYVTAGVYVFGGIMTLLVNPNKPLRPLSALKEEQVLT